MPDIGQILRDFDIPWPAADEGSLREAASIWHGLAETIRDNYGQANSSVESLTSDNAGAAIDAFTSYWQKLGGTKGALPLGAEACDAIANTCTSYADAVADAQHRIEEAGEELAAVLVIGTIGAIISFGATEGAAAVAASELAAYAAGVIEGIAEIIGAAFAQFSVTIGAAILTAGDAVSGVLDTELAMSITSSAIAAGAGSGVIGSVYNLASNSITRALNGEQQLNTADTVHDVMQAGYTGAAGGMLGQLGEMTCGQVADMLTNSAQTVAASDPQLYMSMMTLAKQLEGLAGKITTGIAASAASQLIAARHIDAEGVVSDVLTDRLTAAADGDGEGGG
jgi:hypothetical protein